MTSSTQKRAYCLDMSLNKLANNYGNNESLVTGMNINRLLDAATHHKVFA
jgi:hypothetical protein